jgi:hypothetical protein
MKIIAIILGGYLCQESFYYQGIYTGYNIGAVRLAGICYPKIGNLCISHGDPYSDLVNIHVYINWCLIFFIASKLIKKEALSHIISLPSIILAFLLFVYVYIFKNRYVTDDATYINVIRETLPTDFIHIWLALAIVIYQMITIIQYYFAWKRDSVKVE